MSETAIDCSYSIEGSGSAIFLTHGVGAAKDAWRLITPKLKKQYTIITYALRGHDKSHINNKDFNLDSSDTDLERLSEEKKNEKAHLIRNQ